MGAVRVEAIGVVTGWGARRRGKARAPFARPAAPLRLEAAWADSLEDLREVQRLRFQVFAGEGGARLSPPPGTPPATMPTASTRSALT